jgi:hypothetical protein
VRHARRAYTHIERRPDEPIELADRFLPGSALLHLRSLHFHAVALIS